MNSKMNVNASIMRSLMCLVNANVEEAINFCAKKYGFDVNEAKELYMTENEVKVNVVKKKEKVLKVKFPVPFNGKIKENCCKGLKLNNGLYTQCEYNAKEGEYCKGCVNQKYGNVMERIQVGLYEYRDPSGKKPVGYKKVLNKLKLSEEYVREEAEKAGIEIDEEHFEYTDEEVKEKKGRPKKAKKVMKNKGNDEIFSKDEEEVKDEVEVKVEKMEEVKVEVKVEKVEEKKVEEKKKPRKQESQKSKKAKEKVKAKAEEEEEEEEADVVKRVEINGKKYLKSKKTNTIYNMDQELIGIWNEKTQKIDLNEESDLEEEEEE